MPKKKNPETQEQQSARFLKDAAALEAAGELNPIEGAKALDKLLDRVKRPAGQGSS
jgi:hypothetical protein